MSNERSRRWQQFAIALTSVALFWLVILPWLGRQNQVAKHIQWQQSLNIDPSAMYYSELEILPAIAHRVERLHDYYGFAYRQQKQVASDRRGE